ncbi:MAG: hypothetical protein ACOYJL_03215 [Tractidigestivibacter sp.]|jgi:hypothetical protein|uniref:hypothetical protein n=1 Tax=Tractidigestivibacter sp. TaxID=2847320 RepID=UPI003D938F10
MASKTPDFRREPIKACVAAVRSYFEEREWLLCIVCAIGVAAGVLVLVWFLAFSGLNEPVQFIYDSF